MRPCGPGKLFIHSDSPSAHLLPSTLSDSHDSYRNCLLWDSDSFLSWGRCKKFGKRKKDRSSEFSQMCFFKPWLELSISSWFSDVLWQEGCFCLLIKIDPNSFSHYVHVPGLSQPVSLASLPAHPSTSRVRRQQLPTGGWRKRELAWAVQGPEGTGKQPTAEVSGSGAGKLVTKIRTHPSSFKKRPSIPFSLLHLSVLPTYSAGEICLWEMSWDVFLVHRILSCLANVYILRLCFYHLPPLCSPIFLATDR